MFDLIYGSKAYIKFTPGKVHLKEFASSNLTLNDLNGVCHLRPVKI